MAAHPLSARRWNAANREKMREYARNWARRNRTKVAETGERWRQDNRDRHNAKAARYRSAKFEASLPWFPEGWDAEIYRQAAAQGLHVDHIVPLTPCRVCGQSGLHAPGNLQLLPSVENTAKGNRCQDCWQHERGPIPASSLELMDVKT